MKDYGKCEIGRKRVRNVRKAFRVIDHTRNERLATTSMILTRGKESKVQGNVKSQATT